MEEHFSIVSSVLRSNPWMLLCKLAGRLNRSNSTASTMFQDIERFLQLPSRQYQNMKNKEKGKTTSLVQTQNYVFKVMHSVILCREGGIAVITVFGFPHCIRRNCIRRKVAEMGIIMYLFK